MTSQEIALGFSIAAGVGLLVGLERERSALVGHRERFGGIRTFPLIALLGCLSGLFENALGPTGFALPFAAAASLVALAYMKDLRTGRGGSAIGLTTEFAALLVFAIGALPFLAIPEIGFKERLVVAGALGAVVMAALSLRQPLHTLAARVNREDLIATVRFVLLAAVALPLLPDRAWDPWGALNPFKIGIFVVLIAGVSFFGYVAVRALGTRRGIGLTGAFGGLVSSTAVTLSFSGRTRTEPSISRVAALAIVIACTIMFPRMMLLVGIVRGDLLVAGLPVFGTMLIVSAVGAFALWLHSGRSAGRVTGGTEKSPEFVNPFSLKQALKLGLAFAVIRLVAAFANSHFGSGGLFATATLGGLVDVDPITIAVTRMFAGGAVTREAAVIALTLAALTNNVIKTVIVFVVAGRKVGFLVGAVLLPATAAGILAAVLL